MALELKKIFSILKIILSVLNKGKTYVLVLRFFEEYTLAVFAEYYTRSLFPLPAFLNAVAGIHPGPVKLNEIKGPVLEFFLTCIERDSLCYNIFVSSQELCCRHKPVHVFPTVN